MGDTRFRLRPPRFPSSTGSARCRPCTTRQLLHATGLPGALDSRRRRVLAAGSDAPVVSADPMPFHNIEMAVTRDDGDGPLNASEGIGILDAIDAYDQRRPHDAAGGYHRFAGNRQKADFIILDRDIIALANEGRTAG